VEEYEDRLGEEEVVLMMMVMMVMMMSRMVVRMNVNVNRMGLREEVLYWLAAGYKLSRGCMTSKNLQTWSFLASACLVKFQMVYMLNHCFFILFMLSLPRNLWLSTWD